ncbi:hypothetical protein FNV43_RR27096 [Rhamnella rubrinervis]|uniref:BAG domain-containing protein n=1 Tax=Rhamnella rubrinervis TaxID=2594499 RepID=A0A8K0GPD0_9ROSA|nr:hypothetical protein FNV43_RR27096 [Rhamnella rubrinervis]
MESPFFRNRWNNLQASRPVYSPSVTQVPVQRQAKPKPKVVSIPVRFVGSEQSRSDSTVKIQKVFRGFLVRKSVKKIAAIRDEVDEIAKRISKPEMVELIQRESKERLRVTETLMNLLFRLDSIRGVDSGVRDCRKAVIKKAIALQERVDSIVAGDQTSGAVNEAWENNGNVDSVAEAADEATETKGSDEDECPATSLEDCSNFSEIDLDQNHGEPLPDLEISPETAHNALDLNASAQTDGTVIDDHEKMEPIEAERGTDSKAIENKETFSDDGSESNTGQSPNPQSLVEGGEENEKTLAKEDEDGMEIVVEAGKKEEEENCGVGGEKDNKRNSKNMLEKMMEENERMMGMMTELFERNELQTRCINALTQKVEQLERALVCGMLRKKKKRRAASAALFDCPEKSKNSTNKFGNR